MLFVVCIIAKANLYNVMGGSTGRNSKVVFNIGHDRVW
jgi:hypothetical protein